MIVTHYRPKSAHRPGRRSFRAPLLGLLCAVLGISVAGPANAVAGPIVELHTSTPDFVTSDAPVRLGFVLQNTGDAPLEGDLAFTDVFPVGLGPGEPFAESGATAVPITCETVAQTNTCTLPTTGLLPEMALYVSYVVPLDPGASGVLVNSVEVSGGGAPPVSDQQSLTVGPPGPFGFKAFTAGMFAGAGVPTTQAGSDPAFQATAVSFPTQNKLLLGGFPITATVEPFKDVLVHVPAGFVGNPTSTPVRCTGEQFTRGTPDAESGTISDCPRETQVGVVRIANSDQTPLYNMVPPIGAPAAFGFSYQSATVLLVAKLRPSDNGIDISSVDTSTSVPIPGAEVTLWGVPAAASHDPLRGACLERYQGSYKGRTCPSSAPKTAFLRMPTSCTGTPLPWSAEANTYAHLKTILHAETTSPAVTGCDAVPFHPTLSILPSVPTPHSPSGLEVNLSLPQAVAPEGLAEADLRAAAVTLPRGMSIDPPSADGLQACSDAQLRLGIGGAATCPEASKLGSVSLATPLLDHPLDGSVFLRAQNSADPASGELYRLAIEIRSDDDGVDIKLPGSLEADLVTGQLTTTFRNLPQLPFSSMQLRFKSGPRAPLTTPPSCGTYSTHAELTSWARPNQPVPIDSTFTIDQGCAAVPFDPALEAGVAGNSAGAFSPFTLRVSRGEGGPNISRIDATLPEGELAKLAGVPLCNDAAAASHSCPAASQIGRTIVAVGYGSNPLYVPQPGKAPTAVYLAGPYKGAPYSVVVEVPAQAGPFDLGAVAVRSKLAVDPVTTQASVDSDPLPQIIGGIPVAYRDIRVIVDRSGFTVNPTSCEPKAVSAMIASDEGQSAKVSDRFQVADCGSLAFKPKLALRLSGGTRRAAHPALRATLTMPKANNANIARVSVALPHSEFLAQSHIRTICTRVQFAAGAGNGAECPQGSVYGHARAISPLLDGALEGPVYLRSSNHPLPDLVAALHGQIDVVLAGRIDQVKGGIRTTFARVPDAPVSKFVLSMQGGRKGLLENSTNLCRSPHRATAKFAAQNGRPLELRPLLRSKCSKGS